MSRLHEVTKKFRETVREWDLWRPKERIGIAVSGGIDSMVLLHLVIRQKAVDFGFVPAGPASRQPLELSDKRSQGAARLSPSRTMDEIDSLRHTTVFHFNHKLRDTESEDDALFIKKVCEDWEIPFVLGEAPPWGRKNNLQERARQLRYDFFKKEMSRFGISKLATAHQADDQAETFLIRWIQGAGLKGLSGIPLVRRVGAYRNTPLHIIRPLFFVTRDEIADYAKRFEVPFREDSSNREQKYLRNKIRPILSELRKLNPKLGRRSAVNSILLRADEDYLETVEKIDRLNIGTFIKLPPSLRYRLLQRMYEEVSGHLVSGEFVLKIDSLIRDSKPKREYSLPHGVRFEKDYVRFLFKKV